MTDWTWVLCDHDGTAAAQVVNATTRQFDAQRNKGRWGTITLTHDDPEADLLLNTLLARGTPQLRVYRDMALQLSAYLDGVDEDVDDEGQDTLTVVFKDPFAGRLLGDGDTTGRFTGADVIYTATDQGAIAWDLINDANAIGDTGLAEGSIEATTDRDRSYDQENIGQAITRLTEVVDGFDFEVLPLDPTTNSGKLGEFTVYAAQGADHPGVLFGFGAGTVANVKRVSRTLRPPVTLAHVRADDGTTDTQPTGTVTSKYGVWEKSKAATTGTIDSDTLTEKAQDLLRPEWIKVVTIVPDPTLAPQPVDDYWLGDTCRFEARQGALAEVNQFRVDGISVVIDANDAETVTLTTEVVED